MGHRPTQRRERVRWNHRGSFSEDLWYEIVAYCALFTNQSTRAARAMSSPSLLRLKEDVVMLSATR